VLVCGSLQALESGKLTQGGVVTEGSAGSTAISLATVAPAYGCKCHVVIPDDAAIEKVYMEQVSNEQSSVTNDVLLLLL
jgi:cysteine synthase